MYTTLGAWVRFCGVKNLLCGLLSTFTYTRWMFDAKIVSSCGDVLTDRKKAKALHTYRSSNYAIGGLTWPSRMESNSWPKMNQTPFESFGMPMARFAHFFGLERKQ